nr:hypothetical protein [Eubacterium sp.]
MGTWETGLYQNDVSQDVKDTYMQKLWAGKSDEEALEETLKECHSELHDDDDKYDAYFGLVDVMWKKGRLTESLREEALVLICEEKQNPRFENNRQIKQREKVLDKLETQLKAEMPARKRISVHKPFVTKFKPGEVYLYPITNPPKGKEMYKGWWAVIYVNRLRQHEWKVKGVWDTTPYVYVKLAKEKPTSLDEINDLPFVVGQVKWKTAQGIYERELADISNRAYPKTLEYFGVMEEFEFPAGEMEIWDLQLWFSFEKDVIRDYELELERQELDVLLTEATGMAVAERGAFEKMFQRLPKLKGVYDRATGREDVKRSRLYDGHCFEAVIKDPPKGKEKYAGWKVLLYIQEVRILEQEKAQVPFVYLKLVDRDRVAEWMDYIPWVCMSVDETTGGRQYLARMNEEDAWGGILKSVMTPFFFRRLPDGEENIIESAPKVTPENFVQLAIDGYERELAHLGFAGDETTPELIYACLEKDRHAFRETGVLEG